MGGIIMAAITEEMVACAYRMARRVYTGEMGRTEARLEINRQTGMDAGSAGDYISAFLCMMEGDKCYKRTINLFATEYYLEHIGIDYGRDAQIRAAGVVKDHVKYYESVMSYQAQTDKIADSFLDGVDASQMNYQTTSYSRTATRRTSYKRNNSDMAKELGEKLRSMYEMPDVNKAAMIHLFGIINADIIESNRVRVPDIVREAGLSESYKTELSKGMKLAKYVQLKEEYKDIF